MLVISQLNNWGKIRNETPGKVRIPSAQSLDEIG